jgi:glycosyltransferase involved in cell wall biosynthesis
MSITQRLGAHLPHSVARPLRGVQAIMSVDEPRHAARALDVLTPRNRRTMGRAMVAISRLATPGARRTGRPALLEAVGRGATGDMASSVAILHRVAASPETSVGTRVEIGLMLLQMRDVPGAQRIVDRFAQGQDARTPERYLLETRLHLATARYADAARSASMAVTLAPDRRAPRALLAQATAERDVHDPEWRPSVPAPSRSHVPQPGHPLLIVSNALPRQSGYAIRTQSIGDALRNIGLHPLIAARRQEDILRGERPPERWTVGEVGYQLTASGRERRDRPDLNASMNARGVAAMVEDHAASVLHPATPWPNLQVALAVRERYGLPVVYEVRGFREESWVARSQGLAVVSAHREAEAGVETALMRQADAIVTLSERMRDQLVERGIPTEDITVITNAVDAERFTPQPRDDALARRLRLGDGPVIGYISTLAVYEGIETLIAATAELRRRGRGVRCLIVGEGPHGSALREFSRSLGLDDGVVIFTGRVAYADINAYYSLIDAFVVPRQDVGVTRLVTPLKPYEAMAMERVVVMSRLDALMEMIIEGETGVSFTSGDARDLADVLEPLLVDPERRQQLGRAAGEWVREHRNWRRNGERYLELYQRLGAA